MRIILIIKITAGLAVAGVVTFTSMLAYHIAVEPLGGVFERLIPNAGSLLRVEKEEDFAKALEAAEMVDYEPGDRAFQKAHELIAMGLIAEGREKLTAIVNVFPSSPSAPTARRIVGEMNLDEILSSSFEKGKTQYTVKSGDSYYAIVERNKTSLDMVMHLNRMMELDVNSLQPGDEMLLMPLDFRIVIEPHRKSIALWDGAKFICEYPIMNISGVTLKAGKTTIASRRATINGTLVSPISKEYRSTSKSIQLEDPTVHLFPYDKDDEDPPLGIYLRNADIEELFLLTRSGNEVEIRVPKSR